MKKFIIVGNINAVNYNYVFPYIMTGEITAGTYQIKKFIYPDGNIDWGGASYWYSNFRENRNNDFVLNSSYSPDKYERYNDIDAINIPRIENIPYDYYGNMGVPITVVEKMKGDGLAHFLDKDGHEILFKVIGKYDTGNGYMDLGKPTMGNKKAYKRIAIKRLT